MSGSTPWARLRTPLVSATVAALGLVALAGVGAVVAKPATVPSPPTEAPLVASELVCAATLASASLTSSVSAAVVPLPTVTTGTATLADLSTRASSAKPVVLSTPGATTSRATSGRTVPPALAQARGSFASGLAADQSTWSTHGNVRGLAEAPCSAPTSDAWLLGGGATVGRVTQVLLVNDDDRPAQVDLALYGPQGDLSSPASTGIVVPAGGRRQVRLDALAPGTPVFGVHVMTRVGRVVVLGVDQISRGLVPQGLTFLPPTTAGRHLVVPDVQATPRSARLLLVSPDGDATVTVRMVTPDGTITPVGFEEAVTVPAGKVVGYDIGSAMQGQNVSLVITSDLPLAAGAFVTLGSGPALQETDAVSASPALTGTALVSGLIPVGENTVFLSAPQRAARVRLELVGPGATTPAWTTTVAVPAGTLSATTLPVSTAGTMLVVTPLSGGPVYAARRHSIVLPQGRITATAAVVARRTSASVPAVESVPGSSAR